MNTRPVRANIKKVSNPGNYTSAENHLRAIRTILTNRYAKLEKLKQHHANTFGGYEPILNAVAEIEYLYEVWKIAFNTHMLDKL